MTWCIHQAQFPHWKRRQVSIDQHFAFKMTTKKSLNDLIDA